MRLTARTTRSQVDYRTHKVAIWLGLTAALQAWWPAGASETPGMVDRPSERPLEQPEFLPPQEQQPEFELPPVIEPPAAETDAPQVPRKACRWTPSSSVATRWCPPMCCGTSRSL